MRKTPFSVFCFKKEHYYKLQVIVAPQTNIQDIPLDKITTGTKKRKAQSVLINLLGLWDGHCKADGIKIEEIELVLPPGSEYLFWESSLKYTLMKNYGIFLYITTGVQINSEEGHIYDKRGNNADLLLLKERNIDLN